MSLVSAIVERVKASHPYEVPGIPARPIVGGNPDYLEWIAKETETPQAMPSIHLMRDTP
jgi:periplasmic divalent cation tolerance protein